jgi:phage protein U
MARSYLARLGGFTFAIDTAAFHSLQRASDYRWQAHNRIGRQPALQFTGPGRDTIQLAGVIYPHFAGGMGQVGQMRSLAGQGVPLPLIYSFESLGQYCGLWCILGIDEVRTTFMEGGLPKRIDFRLEIEAYGEDLV